MVFWLQLSASDSYLLASQRFSRASSESLKDARTNRFCHDQAYIIIIAIIAMM